jgi:DEAD/DEAH box helicase domain-containing protein
MPFRRGEGFGSLGEGDTGDALGFLAERQVLHEAGGVFHWATDAYPANNVSLRSIGWDNVVIVDVGDVRTSDPHRGEHVNEGRSFAEMDWRGAHTMLHEQAIYQHDGETYQVERFDYENHKAYVRKVDPDYYTDAMTYTQVSVIEESDTAPLVERRDWPSGWGEVAIVEKVVGYKKIKFFTHENAGYGDVRLPEMQMHTTAFWVTVPERVCESLPAGRAAAIDALRGIGMALEGWRSRPSRRSRSCATRAISARRSATPRLVMRRTRRRTARRFRARSAAARNLATARRSSSTSTRRAGSASPSGSTTSARSSSHARST